MIAVGDMVRVRAKPQAGRGAYRVTEVAWSERTYRVTRIEHGSSGPLFTLEGWGGGPLTARDIRLALAEGGRAGLDFREARNARAARDAPFAVGPAAP